MLAGCLVSKEETCRLNNNVSLNLVPLEVSRIHLSGDTDLLAVHNEVSVLNLYIAFERSVNRVILEHVSKILWIEKVIDTYNLDVV